MKIFMFAASLRKDSFNKKLIQVAAQFLKNKVTVDLAQFNDFPMPAYDGDLEDASGIPEGAKKFIERIITADAVIISSPEYNGGIPGTLKNALDWATRNKTNPFAKKPFFLMGATPGILATVRGLWQTRVPLEAVGAFVSPDMYGLAKAHEAFNPDGSLVDPKNQTRLADNLNSFVDFATRLTAGI